MPPVREGQEVWIKTPGTTEAIVQPSVSQRSVPQRSVPLVTPTGRLTSRNRSQIRIRDSKHSIKCPSVLKDSFKLPPHSEKTDVIVPTDVCPDVCPNDVATPVDPELPASRPRRVIKKPEKLDL